MGNNEINFYSVKRNLQIPPSLLNSYKLILWQIEKLIRRENDLWVST